MSRLKTLYTYLITNQQSYLDGWRVDYEEAINDTAALRMALNAGQDITSKNSYVGTSFEHDPNPWERYARRHLYEKENGVASRGQSTLSERNFQVFIKDSDFICALAELIKNPEKEQYLTFDKAWSKMADKCNAGRNPLLVNRMLGACTLSVSSTVNESKFMIVYGWLANEGIIREPKMLEDWFDKNTHLMTWLCDEFSEELSNGVTSQVLLSIFVWQLYTNLANPFSLKRQIIRYGAPGTGKTFTAMRDSELSWQIWSDKYKQINSDLSLDRCRELVQFHPSYGYEDFIEGLKPVLQDGVPILRLQNGCFKSFCRRAGLWELDVHKISNFGAQFSKIWTTLTLGQLRPHFSELNGDHWSFIKEREDEEKLIDLVPPYFFIIDEINRAELSRVLGELMICLEYRGVVGAITTQYASLNSNETGMLKLGTGFRFFVPHNVFVIGTMNTIDRSVESFDLALRRRFRWERIDPDIQMLSYHLKAQDTKSGVSGRNWAQLAANLENLNDAIRKEQLLGEDYEVGHAYLMNLAYDASLRHTEIRENVWEDALRPLLEEYLRGSGKAESLIPDFAKAFGL